MRCSCGGFGEVKVLLLWMLACMLCLQSVCVFRGWPTFWSRDRILGTSMKVRWFFLPSRSLETACDVTASLFFLEVAWIRFLKSLFAHPPQMLTLLDQIVRMGVCCGTQKRKCRLSWLLKREVVRACDSSGCQCSFAPLVLYLAFLTTFP